MQDDQKEQSAQEPSSSPRSGRGSDGQANTAGDASSPQSVQNNVVDQPDEIDRSQLLLNVQPPQLASPLNVANSLIAVIDGRFVGRLAINNSINLDLRGIDPNSTQPIAIAVTLYVQGNQLGQAVATPQPSQNQQSKGTTKKRPAPDATSTPSPKKRKQVATGAPAIPSKGVEYYSKAMLKPEGMTKEETDICLTCLRHNRKCTGTQLFMVRGTVRCETCAHPGTGTSSRICYYRDPEQGVNTYEDAQEILGPSYGGRKLDKNARPERLLRQEEVGDTENEEDANDVENDEQGEGNPETDSPVSDDVQSGAQSSYESLRQLVAQDLHLPVDGQTSLMRLAIGSALRDMFTGIGPHQEYLLGIPGPLLRLMPAIVARTIRDAEAQLRLEQEEGEEGQSH